MPRFVSLPRDPAFYDESIDTCFIPLTKGKWAMVSGVDRDLAMSTWYAAPRKERCYAMRDIGSGHGRRVESLHRIIAGRLGVPIDGLDVDHINHDGLDNRRHNLRAATRTQNNGNGRKPSTNRSGYKGVSFHAKSGRWCAWLHFEGRSRYLGLFQHAVDAARAYDREARRCFGSFACTNFPEDPVNDNSQHLVGEVGAGGVIG